MPPETDQGQQPAGRIAQQAADLFQFRDAADERRQLHRQVGLAAMLEGAIADACPQRRGLGLWLGAQFLAKGMPADLVLREGRAALSAERQGTHQLAVRRFSPRFQRELSSGVLLRFLVVAETR